MLEREGASVDLNDPYSVLSVKGNCLPSSVQGQRLADLERVSDRNNAATAKLDGVSGAGAVDGKAQSHITLAVKNRDRGPGSSMGLGQRLAQGSHQAQKQG